MNESNEYFVEIFCEVSAEILSRESVMIFFFIYNVRLSSSILRE